MAEENTSTEGRGLLTEAEREALAGERSDSYRYKTRSYLKRRIEKVERDADVLAEHAPDLLADLQAAVSESDESGRESVETPATPQREQPDASPTEPTSDAVAATLERVNLPEGHTPQSVGEGYAGVREYLRAEGPATKKEIVRKVMPSYPLGYDAEEAIDKIEAGERFRGAWWRKIVKPALDSDPEVGYRDNHNDYNINE